MTLRAEERARRSRRRRLVAGVALATAALGVPLLLRRLATAPPLPPHGWGRGHRYVWRGEEVHFQQVGDGPPVLLLHSLGPGHDSAEWEGAAELLSHGCELYAPDLPGWGRSAAGRATTGAALCTAFLGDFLVDVVRQPAVVVAAGGAAAFAVAAAAGPARDAVRALALVTPSGLAGAEETPARVGRLLARLARMPLLAGAALQLFISRGAIQRHLEREVFAAPERADAARREHCYRSARQPGAQATLLAWLAGDLDLDVAAALPLLSCPLWLGWGREAATPPVETADLWLHLAPRAHLEVFDGSGMLPHLEVPVEFTRRLRSFLLRV